MTTRSSIPTIIDNHGGSIIAALVANEQTNVANFLRGFIGGVFILKHKQKLEAQNTRCSAGVTTSLRQGYDGNNNDYSTVENEAETSLIAQRLLGTGICKTTDDFEVVADKVSKEVVGHCEYDNTNEIKRDHSTEADEAARRPHVKTGVWEVITFEQDGTPNEPFYVVTGVSVSDRVDAKKLRKAIFKGQSFARRPKIHWAPILTAEALTGYKSGTMAPICHTKYMKLFLEETVAQGDADKNIVCGSGTFGKGLSLTREKFLEIARLNPEGFEAVPLVQRKKNDQVL